MSTDLLPRVLTYYIGDKRHREYTHKVDFIPLNKTEGIRGLIMFSIPMQKQSELINAMINKKLLFYFCPKIRVINNTNPKLVWIKLRLKNQYMGAEAMLHLRTLLDVLKEFSDIRIIWKEDRHGYEIDSFGGIKRKWKLHPF